MDAHEELLWESLTNFSHAVSNLAQIHAVQLVQLAQGIAKNDQHEHLISEAQRGVLLSLRLVLTAHARTVSGDIAVGIANAMKEPG